MGMITLTEENTVRTTIEVLTTMISAETSPMKRTYLVETRERMNMILIEFCTD